MAISKSRITNASSGPITVPAPWSRVLGAGKDIVVTGTVDSVIASLGGVDAVNAAFLKVSQADDSAPVTAFDEDSLGMFGDGSDGALAVTATTTEAGENEMFYTDVTVGASGIYKPAGRRIFVLGTLTVEDGGIIQADGAAAAADVAGAGGGAAAFTLAGTAGGAGQQAAGSAGTAANAAARIVSPTAHGAGGAGGAGTSAAGAAGAQSATKSGNMRNVLGMFSGGAALAPGTGGGGGGGDNAAIKGGGGGGGGGVILIFAQRVVFKGATPVRSAGGAGAAGAGDACGGGGGGGGGAIAIVTRDYQGPTLTAAANAAGGAAGASGGAGGAAGTAGGAGYVKVLTI